MKNFACRLKLKHFSVIQLLILFQAFGGGGNTSAYATDMLPRAYFEQPLEPTDMVLNGMGQIHVNEYVDYKAAMGSDELPVIWTSDYLAFKTDGPQDPNDAIRNSNEVKAVDKWADQLETSLQQIGGFIIPNISILMSTTMDGKGDYSAEVASGKHDDAIREFALRLKKLDRPVFIRLGDEFNGEWMNLDPAAFKAAYVHIWAFIRFGDPGNTADNGNFIVNAAFVWNVSVDSYNGRYIDFYPGDHYVDWWGINLFSGDAISKPITEEFMQDSISHHKPVFIGESSPRGFDLSSQGELAWQKFFKPYFGFIRNHANVKAFMYVNTKKTDEFPGWGDSRVETSTTKFGQKQRSLLDRFRDELSLPLYLHQKLDVDESNQGKNALLWALHLPTVEQRPLNEVKQPTVGVVPIKP